MAGTDPLTFPPADYPNDALRAQCGIGLTSQRVRDRLVARLMDEGLRDVRVIEALRVTPRHLFVDEALASRAYENTALPIGYGQTISQPWVVAMMTQALLAHHRPQRVLEVGTGSGYQTAVLAQLVPRLWSAERICPLQARAQRVLSTLGLAENVHFRCPAEVLGWPEEAPFDAILSAAAPETIPQGLLDQLAVGGRLVIPVGNSQQQELLVIDKTASGIQTRSLGDVLFVPLISGVAG